MITNLTAVVFSLSIGSLLFVNPTLAAETKPQEKWMDVECVTETGDLYEINGRLRLDYPSSNMDKKIELKFNENPEPAVIFQAQADPLAKRLYLEIVRIKFTTPEQDRSVSLLVGWMDKKADPALAYGVLTDTLENHKTGKFKSGPEQRVRCMVTEL